MKKKNNFIKWFILTLMAFIFLITIIFTFITAGQKLTLDYKFNGGFEARVGVYDKNKIVEDNKPNGDARSGANALESKLSPFSDKAVEVKVSGQNRVVVKTSKELYSNNEFLFKSAIEQDGGLFILNNSYNDILFDKDIIKLTGLEITDEKPKPLNVSDILGDTKAVTLTTGNANKAYLSFDLNNDYLSKIIEGNETTKNINLTMINNMESLLNNVRNYFVFADDTVKSREEYTDVYFDQIISPLRNWSQKNDNGVLNDFFTVKVTRKDDRGNEQRIITNLINGDNTSDKWWATGSGKYFVNTVDDLRKLIYGTNDKGILDLKTPNKDHKIEFLTSTNKYLYDPNAKTEDFAKDGKFSKTINDINGKEIAKNSRDAFEKMAIPILKEVVFKEKSEGSNLTEINPKFNQEIFRENIVFVKQTISPSNGTSVLPTPFITPGDVGSNSPLQANKLYIPAYNNTIAKFQEAQIKQSVSGLSFKVLYINKFAPAITTTMLILFIAIIAVVILVIMIYITFAYRLLGLFTIIIALALCGVVATLPIVFGLVMGAELLLIMFITLVAFLEIAIIYFEAFKHNMFIDKHSIESANKIANKETLLLSLDAMMVSIIPMILLFILSTGTLKNIATILILAILLVSLAGIVILRIVMLLIIKSHLFVEKTFLLPIDTSGAIRSNSIIEFRIKSLSNRFDHLNNKPKLSSKELAKIKKIKDKIDQLTKLNQDKISEHKVKSTLKHEAKILKLNNKTIKLETQKEKRNQGKENINNNKDKKTPRIFIQKWNSIKNMSSKWINKLIPFKKENRLVELTVAKEYYNSILNNDSLKEISINENRLIEKKTIKWNKIFILILTALLIVSLSVGLTIGPNFDKSFGLDISYTIKGQAVANSYSKIESIASNSSENDITDQQTKNLIKSKFDEATKIANDSEFKDDIPQKQAYILSEVYYELLTKNKAHNIPKAKKLDRYNFNSFNSWISYGAGYEYEVIGNDGWVTFETTNKIKGKELTYFFSFFNGGDSKTSDIIKTQKYPSSTSNHFIELLIVLGFTLLALMIYISIRFKWTYFVAMAIGVILIMGTLVATLIIFQVPIGQEILATIVIIISFSLLSVALILGKGKTFIKSKDDLTLKLSLADEVNAIHEFKTHRQEIKNVISELKKQIHKIKKETKLAIKDLKGDHRQMKQKDANGQIKTLRIQIKATKKQLKKDKINHKDNLNKLAKNNTFIKSVFSQTIKYALFKSIFVIGIYILIALVIIVSMPSIAGMGATLFIGIILTSVITITFVIPVWIWLERRRIFSVNGYKTFITGLKVSSEEQIIKGVND